MTLDKIQKMTIVEGVSATTLGKGAPFSGAFYFNSMSKVENFNTQDWDSIFDNDWIKSLSISIGYKAYVINDVKNSVAIGNMSIPTGNDVVQLGWVGQNVTTMNGYYNRSDRRDMMDVQPIPTTLGLDFIKELNPVKYKSSFRDDKFDKDVPFPHPVSEPVEPNIDDYYYINTRGRRLLDQEEWDKANSKYLLELTAYNRYKERLEKAIDVRGQEYSTADGVGTVSNEFRLGLIAKEVKSALSSAGVEGDYALTLQHKGQGLDVDYVAYDQFIPILINALKDLTQENTDLSARVDALEASIETIAQQVADAAQKAEEGVVGTDPSVGTVQLSRYSGENYQPATLNKVAADHPSYNGYFNESAATLISWDECVDETTVDDKKRRLAGVIAIQVGWPKTTPVMFEANGVTHTVPKASGDFKMFIYLDKDESASASGSKSTPFEMRVGGNVIIHSVIWHSDNTDLVLTLPWN